MLSSKKVMDHYNLEWRTITREASTLQEKRDATNRAMAYAIVLKDVERMTVCNAVLNNLCGG